MELLATLRVYRDNSDGEATSYSHRDGGTNDYRIVLRPKADIRASKYGNLTADVLAHELGHFVGKIAELPVSEKAGFIFSTVNEQLAEEHQAWKIARDIKPDINPKLEADATGEMAQVAKKYPNTPIAFLAK